MSVMKKHTDVVYSMEEFTSNYEQGIYVAPWVVYIGNNTDGYSIIYSDDEKQQSTIEPDFVQLLSKRVENLENEKVYCYQDEYDELVLNGSAWVTHIDGSKREVTFDEKSLYYIYEDDGPVTE